MRLHLHRVYLGPCACYELSRPLKAGDEHHEALQGSCDVLASGPVTQLPLLPCVEYRKAGWGHKSCLCLRLNG